MILTHSMILCFLPALSSVTRPSALPSWLAACLECPFTDFVLSSEKSSNSLNIFTPKSSYRCWSAVQLEGQMQNIAPNYEILTSKSLHTNMQCQTSIRPTHHWNHYLLWLTGDLRGPTYRMIKTGCVVCVVKALSELINLTSKNTVCFGEAFEQKII